jgi:hypothetical protein
MLAANEDKVFVSTTPKGCVVNVDIGEQSSVFGCDVAHMLVGHGWCRGPTVLPLERASAPVAADARRRRACGSTATGYPDDGRQIVRRDIAAARL